MAEALSLRSAEQEEHFRARWILRSRYLGGGTDTAKEALNEAKAINPLISLGNDVKGLADDLRSAVAGGVIERGVESDRYDAAHVKVYWRTTLGELMESRVDSLSHHGRGYPVHRTR